MQHIPLAFGALLIELAEITVLFPVRVLPEIPG
jgi:hypothetical protein